MKGIVLFFCFFPLIIIYIIMKLSIWIIAVNTESEYVRKDSKRLHGPYVEDPYADLDEEGKGY